MAELRGRGVRYVEIGAARWGGAAGEGKMGRTYVQFILIPALTARYTCARGARKTGGAEIISAPPGTMAVRAGLSAAAGSCL